MFFKFFLFLLVIFISIKANSKEIYQTPNYFLQEIFLGNVPKQKVIWLDKSQKEQIKKGINQKYLVTRIKYWKKKEKIIFILEDIGKSKPITTAFILENNVLEKVKILIYRESYGWEVKYPFFTDQFKEVFLQSNGKLSKRINNISGATLSSNALIRMAKLALYLTKFIDE